MIDATRERKVSAVLWAAVWALQVCLGAVSPAWAQRRRAEPEANPQFQQDVQGQAPATGGAPVDPGAAQSPTAPSSAEPAPEPQGAAGRGAQGVQIGSMPAAAAPPPAPTSPLETRVTVRVKDAPLATFLDTISAQAKVNFIITEGLTSKRVTAFLQNVTVREALQILLEIKGLTYQQIGRSNTYVVSPRSQSAPNHITRIYTLNFIPLVPLLSKNDAGQAFGGAVISPAGPAGGGGGGGGATDTGIADGPIAILNVLRTILSKSGRVSVDPRNNSIIVTDIPEVFPQVEQIIAELDRKSPQVMIETQIVEIDSDRSQQLGLEWGGANGELGRFTAGFRDTSFPLNLPNNLSHFHFFAPVQNPNVTTSIIGSGGGSASGASGNNTTGSSGGTAGAPPFTLQAGILDLRSLTVLLRALVSRSEARFLGKPKVLTINNKKATIEITQNTATNQQTLQNGTGSNTQTQTSAERFLTGLVLDVTPQVNKDGYVTMLVEPSFSNVIESAISTPSQRVFDPLTRKASTLLRVRNGQTIVLGGLLQSRETKAVRKVPFFGYIPLIGWLFTSTSVQRVNTDLVIFITPTVVSD